MRFVRAMSGLCGALRIAAKDSPSKLWARDTAPPPPGFDKSKWARPIAATDGDTESERRVRVSMLTKEEAADIFERIRKHSVADEIEALFYGGHSALTRFAN